MSGNYSERLFERLHRSFAVSGEVSRRKSLLVFASDVRLQAGTCPLSALDTAALHQSNSVDGLLKIVATTFLAAGRWSSM